MGAGPSEFRGHGDGKDTGNVLSGRWGVGAGEAAGSRDQKARRVALQGVGKTPLAGWAGEESSE